MSTTGSITSAFDTLDNQLIVKKEIKNTVITIMKNGPIDQATEDTIKGYATKVFLNHYTVERGQQNDRHFFRIIYA